MVTVATAAPRRRTPERNRRRWIGWGFIGPFMVVFVFSLVAPIVYAIYLSFFQDRLIGGTSAGFGNYTLAFQDPQFWSALRRVLLFFAFQVPVMLGLAAFAALALDSARLKWSPLYRIAIFLPFAVPGVIAALMWGFMYGTDFGLIGNINEAFDLSVPNLLTHRYVLGAMANISTWAYVGYNMLVMYSALRTVPKELYESAAIDGAGTFKVIRSIKLPAMRPAFIVTLVFSVIGSFQLFNAPNILRTLSPNTISSNFTPNMYAYNLAFSGQQYNYAAAIAIVMGLLTMVVAYIVQTRGIPRGIGSRDHPLHDAAASPPIVCVCHARHPCSERGGNSFTRPRMSPLLSVLMTLMLIYCLVPLAWLVIGATKTQPELLSSFGLWFSGDIVIWRNIVDTFTYDNGIFAKWLLNTLIYVVVGAGGATILATVAGYGLAHFNFPGKKLVFAIILGAIAIPGTALAVPTFLMFSKIGITNGPWSVILPSLISPFGLYLIWTYATEAIPVELLEAARVDRAGEIRIFFTIALRLLAPGFVTVLLFNVVETWNNYFLPLIMLSNPDWYPLTVGLDQWSTQANQPGGQPIYNLIITGSLLTIVPIILIFLLMQRYWQSGLSAGSVKG